MVHLANHPLGNASNLPAPVDTKLQDELTRRPTRKSKSFKRLQIYFYRDNCAMIDPSRFREVARILRSLGDQIDRDIDAGIGGQRTPEQVTRDLMRSINDSNDELTDLKYYD